MYMYTLYTTAVAMYRVLLKDILIAISPEIMIIIEFLFFYETHRDKDYKCLYFN